VLQLTEHETYAARAHQLLAHIELDREWIETEDGRWIRRSAIVELAVVSE
jgi:hypothetical protein